MEPTTFSDSLKTRIPNGWRDSLETIARREHLAVSDIVRRALVEFIGRQKRAKAK